MPNLVTMVKGARKTWLLSTRHLDIATAISKQQTWEKTNVGEDTRRGVATCCSKASLSAATRSKAMSCLALHPISPGCQERRFQQQPACVNHRKKIAQSKAHQRQARGNPEGCCGDAQHSIFGLHGILRPGKRAQDDIRTRKTFIQPHGLSMIGREVVQEVKEEPGVGKGSQPMRHALPARSPNPLPISISYLRAQCRGRHLTPFCMQVELQANKQRAHVAHARTHARTQLQAEFTNSWYRCRGYTYWVKPRHIYVGALPNRNKKPTSRFAHQ